MADFLAEANIVTGRLLAVDGELGDVEIAGHVVRIPHRGFGKGEVSVAIRPDAIRVHTADDAGGIAGRVVECTIETAGGELFAIVPEMDGVIAAGQRVSLSVNPRGLALVE